MPGSKTKPTIVSKKQFGTPVAVLGSELPQNKDKHPIRSVDEETGKYLEDRKKRLLDNAKTSELEVATEQNLRDAARIRKEKEQIERTGEVPEENDMTTSESKVADAAEVAATAVAHGADPGEAKDLATGKKPVLVISPKPREGAPPAAPGNTGGWSVVGGKPVKDPEGEYTFIQALHVCDLEKKPATDTSSELKGLVDKIEAFTKTQQDKAIEQLNTTIRALTEKIDSINSGNGHGKDGEKPAVKTVVKYLGEDDQIHEATDGVIVLTKTVFHAGDPKQSLEDEKEKNRHEEKMAEVQRDNQNSKEWRGVAAKVVETLADKGSQLLKNSGGGPATQQVDYTKCVDTKDANGAVIPGCGFDIPIPAGGADFLTCPQCKKPWMTQAAKARLEAEQRAKQTPPAPGPAPAPAPAPAAGSETPPPGPGTPEEPGDED